MAAPEKPADECERLKALRATGLLDTASEERFDRYTRLVKRLFGVPIALVSLVDEERQWFKSSQGLDAAETPRQISFCGHAILNDEVFIVEDATQDDRFANNPLVTGDPSIRFYAGCPLSTPEGHRIGTLCIIDRESRDLESMDIESLRDIAAMVSSELSALRLATIDELTGLSNRRAFNIISTQALAFCERTRQPASLLMIDLDGFKQINDELGHACGDEALREFSALLQSSFRSSDLIARLGGDEFAVLMTSAASDDVATGVKRFTESVHQFNCSRRRRYTLAFSSGSVVYNAHEHDGLLKLQEAADQLMYQQKKHRKAQQALLATA